MSKKNHERIYMKNVKSIAGSFGLAVLLVSIMFSNSFAGVIGYFNFEFKGVTYDYQKNQSTWTYSVTGTGQGKALSHWVLALCDDHKVISSNFSYEVNTDPRLGFYGIKWDIPLENDESKTFTFTLNGIYKADEIKTGYKAGQGLYYGKVTGPSCEPDNRPEVKDLTLNEMCSDDPAVSRRWLITNPNEFEVSVSWSIEGTSQSGTINAASGNNYLVTVTGGNNKITISWKDEAGAVNQINSVSGGEQCEQPNKSKLGDRVWSDLNKNGLQDQDEPGVKDVVVNLYRCSDNSLVSAQNTDSDGDYLFEDLPAGDYKVGFVLPAGYVFSPENQASDDALDSDADLQSGYTVCITLGQNETNLTADAGIYKNTPEEKVDLSLVKTADKQSPSDGDNVTFTLTVSNAGPGKATGVSVSDILPKGLDYSSALVSQGNYSEQTGTWSVGELGGGSSASASIVTKVDLSEINTASISLGAAADYNLFLFGNLKQTSSDTEGKLAAGGDVYLSNYSVGDKLSFSHGQENVLIAGRTLTFTSGTVENGNVVYGKVSNLPVDVVSVTGGTVIHGSVIDFEAAEVMLNNLSVSLNEYKANGTDEIKWSTLMLNGSDPRLNVFSIDGSDLASVTDVQISVPNGAVVLVNISGKDIKWSGGLAVNGTQISNVLYNFFEAEKIRIEGINLTGSVLAPKAAVNFVSGVQNGQMIAKSLEGNGQFNNVRFVGNIPLSASVVNSAEVSACDQQDADSTPGNGIAGEDDYSSVTLSVNAGGTDTEPNPGSDGSSNWQPVATDFAAGQIIWTIAYDKDNNIMAGTWGGKIYRSEDDGQTWSVINSDMTVAYIWSLAKGQGDQLFAGTERGIYRSDDNGKTWASAALDTCDIRSIVYGSDGTLYAGAWGRGVYASNDNGTSWHTVNSGLSCLAIQSLSMNSASELYAATFGGGIYKSADKGQSWQQLNISYPHVWAVNAAPNGKVYAGTYGDGVYVSEDNGMSWNKLSSGLASQYIYNIVTDKSFNVYLNSWEAGIYSLTDGAKLWKLMGMEGSDISAITVDPVSGMVFAAAGNGRLYKAAAVITAVENRTASLTGFAVAQNYPNPFNPSTVIRFSIPAQSRVVMKVYDILGGEVATLLNTDMQAGEHSVMFNAANLSTGVYFYRITAGGMSQTRKMVLVK